MRVNISICLIAIIYFSLQYGYLRPFGWWPEDLSKRLVLCVSASAIRVVDEEEVEKSYWKFELIKEYDLVSIFIGAVITLTLMLYYWGTYLYPMVNLYGIT